MPTNIPDTKCPEMVIKKLKNKTKRFYKQMQKSKAEKLSDWLR